jgi:hypothetical protein
LSTDEFIQELINRGYVSVDPDLGKVIFNRHFCGKTSKMSYKPHESRAKLNDRGQLRTCITLEGQIKYIQLARIVWIYMNGPIPDGSKINFKNGDKADLRLSNIELKEKKAK